MADLEKTLCLACGGSLFIRFWFCFLEELSSLTFAIALSSIRWKILSCPVFSIATTEVGTGEYVLPGRCNFHNYYVLVQFYYAQRVP